LGLIPVKICKTFYIYCPAFAVKFIIIKPIHVIELWVKILATSIQRSISDTHRLVNIVVSAGLRAVFSLLILCMMPTAGYAQTFTADWANAGVGNLQGVPSGTAVTAGPRTVTISHSQITNGGAFTPYAPYGNQMLSYFTGQIGAPTGTLLYHMENTSMDAGDRFQSIYTFSGPVTNLAFALADVDRENGGGILHQDGVTIEYDTGTGTWLNIRSTAALYTLGGTVGNATLSGVNGFQGNAANALNSTNGNINVNFGAVVTTRVRITYHFGQTTAGDPTASNQFMGLSDFTFQVAGTTVSDLSLAKAITTGSATPVSGSALSYTLTLSNAAGSAAESNVTVRDVLPTGFSFTSSSGFGTYNSSTGIWTVPSIAAGGTRQLVINGTVTAPNGVTITNFAEVVSQTNFDNDSAVNNGSTTEDDDASAAFTVTGTRTAGTAPSLASTCAAGDQIPFSWNSNPWPAGSVNNTYNIAGVGNVNYAITLTGGTFGNDPLFGGQSPALSAENTGGGAAGQFSLHQFIDFFNQSGESVTTLTLPTAIPGAQFTLFDVDFAANDFADKMTVSGSFNGSPVIPILTNGVSNYVVGNVAIGDAASASTSADGNVIVTFTSPIDTIIVRYGNATTAPANPDGQAATFFNVSFCRPIANLSVTKISSVLTDGVSVTNPKSIPGATVRYCILVSNAGSATATAVSASDPIPANLTFVPGSMFSGTTCGGAATAEDDDAADTGETDPFTMSFNGTTFAVTGNASSLLPSASMALIFNATVN
jgi:uncharacterized repeat protein (TIGR01451 family)